MENQGSENLEVLSEQDIDEQIKSRPRSPTLLKLKMFAESFRRKKRVEEKLQKGEYKVNSKELAEAILNSSD